MIISKKRYEEMIQMIDTQNKQVTELINMVIDAKRQLNYVTQSYVDLVNILDIRYLNLPQEARETIEKIEELIKG